MNTFYLISFILSVPALIGLMKIFEKAGYNKFLALIPFYNAYVWLKVIEKPLWWLIFAFMPFLNIFMIFLMIVETVKTFTKNLLWEQALAVLFPYVYLPILGFSKNERYLPKHERATFHKSKTREWTDAIIFAVFAATIIRTFIFEAYTIPTPSMEKSLLVGDYLFVSKLAYGPKVPNTPIAFPFVHHTLPLSKTTKSYVEWIKFPYHRYMGFREIKNNDPVVFNYPDGDTVALGIQNKSYYAMVRQLGWEYVNNPRNFYGNSGLQFGEVVARPVDKRENYIKRCTAIPGDTLEIINQQVYINGVPSDNPEKLEHNYFIIAKTEALGKKELKEYGMSDDDISYYYYSIYTQEQISDTRNNILPFTTCDTLFSDDQKFKIGIINLSEEMAEKISNHPQVERLEKMIYKRGISDVKEIFPHSNNYPWNRDNFGPLYIPKKGVTVNINTENIVLYDRIIDVYEGNDLEIKGSDIYVNGELATQYTFKMDYYWMMGDNRHNSADSRFWGFVPEDHIVGTPSFIWLSIDKDKGGVRWDRVFMIPD